MSHEETIIKALTQRIDSLEKELAIVHQRWKESADSFYKLRTSIHQREDVRIVNVKEQSLEELQREIHNWEERNFGDQPTYHRFLGIVEEVGELSHAMLKYEQGVRGTPEELIEKGKDAVGDMMVFTMNLCSENGWSLEQILTTTWDEVSQRDWKRYPKNGRTE